MMIIHVASIVDFKANMLTDDTATNTRHPTSKSHIDRYAILQRKVEDLERIHNDSKKAHQSDITRLKAELARYQKSNAELTERQEKQKKHTDGLETRILDLKKAAAQDQTEIRDLRSKYRISENQRNQMATKQGDMGELRRSLQTLQTKLTEETRAKDRRISELEKALALEKKGKDKAEAELQDLRTSNREELIAIQNLSQKHEAEAKQLRTELISLQRSTRQQEEELHAQLDRLRLLVAQVAQDYGLLVQSTVPIDSHTSLQRSHTALQIQSFRLERKLTNSEAQVNELAHLIRQTKDENSLLSSALRETQNEIAFYQDVILATPVGGDCGDSDRSTIEKLQVVEYQHLEAQKSLNVLDTRSAELYLEYYRLTCEQALFEYALAYEQLKHEQQITEQNATALSIALASHEATTAQLESAQGEKTHLEKQLKDATDLVESLKGASAIHDAALKKERDAARRLTDAVQRSRMAEDALRSEIQRLTAELLEAERYQEAYYSLSDEVRSLVARNQLAEEEADLLSKFNAEILSHNNPAQRVMYVDRIRRELAEAKHKLLMLGHEQEAVVAINNDLQQELEMYKSVMVPPDLKPRTTITRVTRAPLVNLTNSVYAPPSGKFATESTASDVSRKSETRYVHSEESMGDMTIEEIT